MGNWMMGASLALVLSTGATALEDQPDWQQEALSNAASLLADGYIYEDKAEQLSDFLMSEGERYADISEPRPFAEAVTADLYELTNDAHLRLIYRPEGEAAAPARPSAERDAAAARSQWCRTAPMEWRSLDDGTGYIQLPRIFGDDAYRADFDTAMEALADAPAMILDVRGNCGGDPQTLLHFSSYFFAEPTHLTSTEMRGAPQRERWTHDNVPGSRFVDRPLIILTDRYSFSAAESFAFGMQVAGRAMTAGETTGGGGHFGNVERVSDQFAIFVPRGRTFDPRTGEGWEATGVVADIEASGEGALDAALAYLNSDG
ncbi:S41 family peptidase [Maricaulis sp.]|uniref:S41 family peptidase n=1 Tax=Maricaulis sp. TaxID=1486257 RepID=UPI002605BD7F|nr:S41 family peptidase [Maricaulis sp.]